MWMSLMTSGVKICERPRMYLLLSAGVAVREARPVAVRATPEPLPVCGTGSVERMAIAPALRGEAARLGLLGGLFAISLSFQLVTQSTSFFSLGSRLS